MASGATPQSVLSVGQICTDLVNVCETYPEEDSQILVEEQYWQRGGNAGNFAEVLSHLGTKAEFFGTFPNINKMKPCFLGGTAAAKFCLAELDRAGVEHGHLAVRECPDFPSTSILLGKAAGTRTIVHFRGPLNELKLDDFSVLDLKQYSWAHFEGRRNVDVIKQAIEMIHKDNLSRRPSEKTRLSVELEHSHLEELMKLCSIVDLVVISRYFGQHLGYESPKECVEGFKSKLKPGGDVVCSWGHDGAACASNLPGNEAELIPAVKPDKVVDTLGAGDTFQAALVHARLNELSLPDSVRFACKVASRKIAFRGFDSVKGMCLNTSK